MVYGYAAEGSACKWCMGMLQRVVLKWCMGMLQRNSNGSACKWCMDMLQRVVLVSGVWVC